jgi:hypothetical protein
VLDGEDTAKSLKTALSFEAKPGSFSLFADQTLIQSTVLVLHSFFCLRLALSLLYCFLLFPFLEVVPVSVIDQPRGQGMLD